MKRTSEFFKLVEVNACDPVYGKKKNRNLCEFHEREVAQRGGTQARSGPKSAAQGSNSNHSNSKEKPVLKLQGSMSVSDTDGHGFPEIGYRWDTGLFER
jgi:hypothetical protein